MQCKTMVQYDTCRNRRYRDIGTHCLAGQRGEIMFDRLTGWLRVATHCDSCPKVVFSAIALVALVIYWL